MLKKLEHCINYVENVNNTMRKVNEIVDAVNGILAAQEQYATVYNEDIVPMLTPENEPEINHINGIKTDVAHIGECISGKRSTAGGYHWKLVSIIDAYNSTRKALEIAVDLLKRIDETRSGVKENLHATNGKTLNAGNGFCWATIDDIHNALEQITALKQKDE